MPITPYLNEIRFDPETRLIMGLAFEVTCLGLKLTARDESIKSLIASKIIELARAGEVDPERLCERTLIQLRLEHFRVLRNREGIPKQGDL